jgi:hypothetical protein
MDLQYTQPLGRDVEPPYVPGHWKFLLGLWISCLPCMLGSMPIFWNMLFSRQPSKASLLLYNKGFGQKQDNRYNKSPKVSMRLLRSTLSMFAPEEEVWSDLDPNSKVIYVPFAHNWYTILWWALETQQCLQVKTENQVQTLITPWYCTWNCEKSKVDKESQVHSVHISRT